MYIRFRKLYTTDWILRFPSPGSAAAAADIDAIARCNTTTAVGIFVTDVTIVAGTTISALRRRWNYYMCRFSNENIN